LRRLDVGECATLVGGEGIGTRKLDQEQIILHEVGAECRLRQRPRAHLAHEVMVDVTLPVGCCGRLQSVEDIHRSALALISCVEEGAFECDRSQEEVLADRLSRRPDAIEFRAQEGNEVAEIGIVVQSDPFGMHEVRRQRRRCSVTPSASKARRK
jgi:hypothetical protein